MGKRYYHKNQTITVRGFKLSVASNGATYHERYDGNRRLDSFWQGKINTLTVTLPDDTMAKLRPTKTGLEIIGDEKKTPADELTAADEIYEIIKDSPEIIENIKENIKDD